MNRTDIENKIEDILSDCEEFGYEFGEGSCFNEQEAKNRLTDLFIELSNENAIQFLDSIRDYCRESGNNLGYDDRESKEFYDTWITNSTNLNL